MIWKLLIGAFCIWWTVYLTFFEERHLYGPWGDFAKFKKPYERVIVAATLIFGIGFGSMFILDGLTIIHISWMNK